MVKSNLWDVLNETQRYISKTYASALTDENKREDLRYYIEKFVMDHGYIVDGFTDEQLVGRLFSEMVEYSVLTPYLGNPDLEEININSWDDVTLTWSDGRMEKLKEHFHSPSHAVDIVKRLLHHSGMIIDNATPMAQGHLPNNTRITAIKTPVVDECCGVSVSIRLLHPQRVDRKCIIESGMATEEMMEFLEMCIRYGVSSLVAGRTNSGKTTLVGALLASIPDDKRIYSIESGARELFLVKKKPNGEILNNVVHTLSRPNENAAYNISQEDLVVAALRFDPDLIVVGEIRDAEANATVEASLTGHTVVTTVHSGPAEAAHGRISLLCQRRFQLGMEVSLAQARQAFPIVAFCHKCEDNNRRVMDISECSVTPDGVARYRCLYRYHITGNTCENGQYKITGQFRKMGVPSADLQTLLIRNGVPYQTLERFLN
ncbi:MAG: CpaF family protein [Clostridia bacterium]|nr:CpaF family protein [Clostridia bacterium]